MGPGSELGVCRYQQHRVRGLAGPARSQALDPGHLRRSMTLCDPKAKDHAREPVAAFAPAA